MSDTSGKPQDYETAIAGSPQSVAEFEDSHRGFVGTLQHMLHVNPSLVPLIVLLASIVIFGLLLGSKFFSPFALTLILQQVQIVGIVAAAQSLVILTAGIDLSVGAIMVMSSVVMGQFTFRYGLPVEVSIACGLLCGAIFGFINGWLIARVKLPPFIVTLGMWQIVLAANFLYSANETIRAQEIEQQASLLQFFGTTIEFGGARLTYGAVFMLLLIFVLAYVLKHTAWGRHVYAVGDDPEAAELSGVNRQTHADFRIHIGGPDLRLCRLGPDRADRIGLANLRATRQYRKHHRRGNRGHISFRWPGLDHGHPVRSADRRCLHSGAETSGRRRPVDLPPHRTSHHRRGRGRPMDQKGVRLMEPILKGRNLVKRYGKVTALDHCDFDLMSGEILAVIGDNGAGKSTLIKAISGAVIPDDGEITLEGKKVQFTSPIEAREHGIETVYQTLAMSPALSIADNMFMGRELRKPGFMGKWLRQLDRPAMEKFARDKLSELGLMTIQNINQAVETLSGGQRQGVAVARAAAFGSKVIILDEPTAALGVKESRRVLELIQDVKSRGIPIILISHNMPHVFEVADRIHVHRLGKRLCVIDPKEHSMSDAVAFMTGAKEPSQTMAA